MDDSSLSCSPSGLTTVSFSMMSAVVSRPYDDPSGRTKFDVSGLDMLRQSRSTSRCSSPRSRRATPRMCMRIGHLPRYLATPALKYTWGDVIHCCTFLTRTEGHHKSSLGPTSRFERRFSFCTSILGIAFDETSHIVWTWTLASKVVSVMSKISSMARARATSASLSADALAF
eukprot:2186274-Prymnesium_polylepis.2